MTKIKNSIKEILINLKISTNQSIKEFYPKVRDRDDVSILKCNKSGAILLSRTDHMNIEHYKEKPNFKYFGDNDREKALKIGEDDTLRRKKLIKNYIKNKNWLDFGTGSGGILDILKSSANNCIAVEPNKIMRKKLLDLGHDVYESIEETKDNFFDFVTLFHVFEHLINPIDTLKTIKTKMKNNSEILIEVPHARDFLIEHLNLDSFKSFTFWSEHIILHVRNTLKLFLEKAGFKIIEIFGSQRYPLSNHLYWLRHNKPGGHKEWNMLNNKNLSDAYEKMLCSIDMNDTLIVRARKIED